MKVSVAKRPRHVKRKRRGNSVHMPRHKIGEGGNDTEGEGGNGEQEKWSVARRKEEIRFASIRVRIYKSGKKRGEGEGNMLHIESISPPPRTRVDQTYLRNSRSHVEDARLAKQFKSILRG